MKKIISIVGFILFLFAFTVVSEAKPIYLPIRIGFGAKWSIVFGDCEPGWGVCLSIKGPSTTQYAGYDPEIDKIIVKISKSDPAVKNFTSSFVLREDSPVDPGFVKGMTNFKPVSAGQNVYIKSGTYKVSEADGFMLCYLDYYIK